MDSKIMIKVKETTNTRALSINHLPYTILDT